MDRIVRGRLDRRQLRAVSTRTLRCRLQRRAFSMLYGPGARFYDRFTDWLFVGEWQRWQDTALPFLPPTGMILEVGSGTGAFAARAASDGRRWYCLEPSRPMIAVAGQRIGKHPHRLIRGDARAIPFAAGAFSGVVATFPASYILAPETHRELGRVVAPGAVLAIVLTGQLDPSGWRRLWSSRLLDLFYGLDGGRGPTPSPAIQIPGFEGTVHQVSTRYGKAHVYVGFRRLAS